MTPHRSWWPVAPSRPGLFDGLQRSELEVALAAAQRALLALQSGSSVASVSFGQGETSRTVTYRSTDTSKLIVLIAQIQKALGVPGARRRPMRIAF